MRSSLRCRKGEPVSLGLISEHRYRLTVPERDERPQRVEDDSRVDDAVVVQLAEILDSRDPLLVVLEVVDFHPRAHVLEHVVEDCDAEVGVEPPEVVQQDGKEVDVAVLDLPHFRKSVVQLADDLLRRATLGQRAADAKVSSEALGYIVPRDPPSASCGRA